MRRGFVLLIVLGLLGVLAGIAVALAQKSGASRQLSQEEVLQTRARLIARSGLEKAIIRILQNPEDPELPYGGGDFDRDGVYEDDAAGVLLDEDTDGDGVLDNEEDQDGDGMWTKAGWVDANGTTRARERWDGILQTEDISGFFDHQTMVDAGRVVDTDYEDTLYGPSAPGGLSNNRNDVSSASNYRFYYPGIRNRSILYNTYTTPNSGSTFSDFLYSQSYRHIQQEALIDPDDGGFMDEDADADAELRLEDVNRNKLLDRLENSNPTRAVREDVRLARVPLEDAIAPSFAINHDYGTPLTFANGNQLSGNPGSVFPKLEYGDGRYYGISGVLGGTFEDAGDTFTLRVVRTGNRINVNMGEPGGRCVVLPVTSDDIFINPWPVNQGLAVFLSNLAQKVADDTFNGLWGHGTTDWQTDTQRWFIDRCSRFGKLLLQARPASGFRSDAELEEVVNTLFGFPVEMKNHLAGTHRAGMTPWDLFGPHITAKGGYIYEAAVPRHQLGYKGYPFVSGDRINNATAKARQHVFPANWVRSLQDRHNGPLGRGDRQVIDINTAPKPLLQAMLRGRSFRYMNPDARTAGMVQPDSIAMNRSYFRKDTTGLLVTDIGIRTDPRHFWFTGSGFPLDTGAFMPERWVPTLGLMEKFPELNVYSSTEDNWNTMCEMVVDAMVRKRRTHPFASFQELEDFLWALARHRCVPDGDGTFTVLKNPRSLLDQYKIAAILACFDPNTRFMKFNPDKIDRHPVEHADQIVDPLFSIGLRRTVSLKSSAWLGNTGLVIQGSGVFHRLKNGGQYFPATPIQAQHMSGLIPVSGSFSDLAGDYIISSLGRIRRKGEIASRRRIDCRVDLFEVLRTDTQADFIAQFNDSSVLDPRVERKTARLKDVMSYPENVYRAHLEDDACTMDGSIQLAKIRHGADLSVASLEVSGTTERAAGSSGIWASLDTQSRMVMHFQDKATRADRRGGIVSAPVGTSDPLADLVDEFETWSQKQNYVRQHDPVNWIQFMNPSPLHATVPDSLQQDVLGAMAIPQVGGYLPPQTTENVGVQQMTKGLPLVSPSIQAARPLDVTNPGAGHYRHDPVDSRLTDLDHSRLFADGIYSDYKNCPAWPVSDGNFSNFPERGVVVFWFKSNKEGYRNEAGYYEGRHSMNRSTQAYGPIGYKTVPRVAESPWTTSPQLNQVDASGHRFADQQTLFSMSQWRYEDYGGRVWAPPENGLRAVGVQGAAVMSRTENYRFSDEFWTADTAGPDFAGPLSLMRGAPFAVALHANHESDPYFALGRRGSGLSGPYRPARLAGTAQLADPANDFPAEVVAWWSPYAGSRPWDQTLAGFQGYPFIKDGPRVGNFGWTLNSSISSPGSFNPPSPGANPHDPDLYNLYRTTMNTRERIRGWMAHETRWDEPHHKVAAANRNDLDEYRVVRPGEWHHLSLKYDMHADPGNGDFPLDVSLDGEGSVQYDVAPYNVPEVDRDGVTLVEIETPASFGFPGGWSTDISDYIANGAPAEPLAHYLSAMDAWYFPPFFTMYMSADPREFDHDNGYSFMNLDRNRDGYLDRNMMIGFSTLYAPAGDPVPFLGGAAAASPWPDYLAWFNTTNRHLFKADVWSNARCYETSSGANDGNSTIDPAAGRWLQRPWPAKRKVMWADLFRTGRATDPIEPTEHVGELFTTNIGGEFRAIFRLGERTQYLQGGSLRRLSSFGVTPTYGQGDWLDQGLMNSSAWGKHKRYEKIPWMVPDESHFYHAIDENVATLNSQRGFNDHPYEHESIVVEDAVDRYGYLFRTMEADPMADPIRYSQAFPVIHLEDNVDKRFDPRIPKGPADCTFDEFRTYDLDMVEGAGESYANMKAGQRAIGRFQKDNRSFWESPVITIPDGGRIIDVHWDVRYPSRSQPVLDAAGNPTGEFTFDIVFDFSAVQGPLLAPLEWEYGAELNSGDNSGIRYSSLPVRGDLLVPPMRKGYQPQLAWVGTANPDYDLHKDLSRIYNLPVPVRRRDGASVSMGDKVRFKMRLWILNNIDFGDRVFTPVNESPKIDAVTLRYARARPRFHEFNWVD